MNRVIIHEAIKIVIALTKSAQTRASIGAVFSHVASLWPKGTKNKANSIPQAKMNKLDLQNIFQIE
jgi:hypothetical protein